MSMNVDTVNDSLVEQSLLEVMEWFFELNRSEGDDEKKYYEQIVEWCNFNVFLRTPWGNFFSGYLHKDLKLDAMIDGERLQRCTKNACLQKIEQLGQE